MEQEEPSTLRVFFAIDLPSGIKAKIFEDILIPLQEKLSNHAIKWTKANNLHLTLHFLEAVKSTEIDKLVENVRHELSHCQSFAIHWGALELFPTSLTPEIISIAIQANEPLNLLVKAIGHGILATRYAIENRPFRGHLTLGRVQQPHFQLEQINYPSIENIIANEIILFSSKLTAEGPNYTILARIKL